MLHPATARTTISSLNAHKSSIDPPPRATITRSGLVTGPLSGSAENPLTALAICGAALSPCTNTGQMMTFTGKRSFNRCKISRMTAPVGDVTTPMVRGMRGMARFADVSNNPSAVSRAFSFSNNSISAPSPASSIVSATI